LIHVRLRPHVRLGPYELESAIGEGGLGEVWKAHDTTSGRLVALRILPTPPPGDPFRFARFEDDIRKVIHLRHPNVARTYELIDVDEVRALASEWVTGDSLATRLAAGPIPADEGLRLLAQAANGLAAAHARDIVHGDVKPSNIWVCSERTVKVIDLGLAEIYDRGDVMPPSDLRPSASARLLRAITGTAAYMSPEQIAGHAADSRADVWAFGCVVYEVLAGRPAFAADDLDDTMSQISGAEPEWTLVPPATPAALVRMLRRCLERDGTRRFQRMTDVLALMREAIGEEGALEAFLRQSALRRMAHRHIDPDAVAGEGPSSPVGPVPHQSGEFTPEVDRADDELRADLRDKLDRLGGRDRAILTSRLIDLETYQEIAARFSLPNEAAARKAVRRAIMRFVEKTE
jgi:serine/threonine protein kinase